MESDQEKIEKIRSLDPVTSDVSPQRGLCRFEPGEDAKLRRAKQEKFAESMLARQGQGNIDGYVPAGHVHEDGEYIASRREGGYALHCIAWRDHGQWRRLSRWSEQRPESAVPHAEILFAPQQGPTAPAPSV